ncbi:MAG: UDP-N-acetylmuramate--L-alanine ligase [Cytophagaceae bacterium]|nr:UDP-N-acetylmuramate--L-alanine ligase [Cytophagaceae bacterium]
MKTLENIQNIYFIGIGGIGMSALARYFKSAGKDVAGYDRTPSKVTKALEVLEIPVVFKDALSEVPDGFLDKSSTLVVYTPAVPASHEALDYFVQNGFEVHKRSVVLGWLTQDKFCLAVAGTHGKTTTTCMLGHLLAEADVPVIAFLGGIAQNYNSNLIHVGDEVIVVEADEFDRSFLQLEPDIACISSMDADHLDIYGSEENLRKSFRDFMAKIKVGGTLLCKKGLPLTGMTVAVNDATADYNATNIEVIDGAYNFDLVYPKGILKDLTLQLPGRHNIFNASMALAMSLRLGANVHKLPAALAGFTGVNRRFSYRIKSAGMVLIDDYAHHPAEIDAVHQAVREMYPQDEVLVVFQPHLFTRTRDFMPAFAKSLSRFDALLLLDIYPAREVAIPGISSQVLLDAVTLSRKQLVHKQDLAKHIKGSKCRIVLMLGAGDIGEEVLKVTSQLTT